MASTRAPELIVEAPDPVEVVIVVLNGGEIADFHVYSYFAVEQAVC